MLLHNNSTNSETFQSEELQLQLTAHQRTSYISTNRRTSKKHEVNTCCFPLYILIKQFLKPLVIGNNRCLRLIVSLCGLTSYLLLVQSPVGTYSLTFHVLFIVTEEDPWIEMFPELVELFLVLQQGPCMSLYCMSPTMYESILYY